MECRPTFASRSGLPVSALSASASRSRLASIRSAMASSSRDRSAAGVRDHAGNALAAASTAASTSGRVAVGDTGDDLAGRRFDLVKYLAAGRFNVRPAM